MIITHKDRFGPKEWLEAGKPMSVTTASTGTDHIDVKQLASLGVNIHNLTEDRAALSEIRASSEWTFAMILLGLRRAHLAINKGTRRPDYVGHELYEKSVGFVGMGRIGHNVRGWCDAFGCTTHYYDPYVHEPGQFMFLHTLFGSCDVIVVCCTLNEKTQHMIGRHTLAWMRQDAVIVNTSRGAVFNESDLTQFLKERPDITFCSDVWEGELTPEYPPFWKLPNVIFTPHIAGYTVESHAKARAIAEKLDRQEYLQAVVE